MIKGAESKSTFSVDRPEPGATRLSACSLHFTHHDAATMWRFSPMTHSPRPKRWNGLACLETTTRTRTKLSSGSHATTRSPVIGGCVIPVPRLHRLHDRQAVFQIPSSSHQIKSILGRLFSCYCSRSQADIFTAGRFLLPPCPVSPFRASDNFVSASPPPPYPRTFLPVLKPLLQ